MSTTDTGDAANIVNLKVVNQETDKITGHKALSDAIIAKVGKLAFERAAVGEAADFMAVWCALQRRTGCDSLAALAMCNGLAGLKRADCVLDGWLAQTAAERRHGLDLRRNLNLDHGDDVPF
jgi:hypothetical protein